MSEDRCIRWERTYASTGWGEDDDFPDRLVSVVPVAASVVTSQEDIFADAAVTARAGGYLEKNPFNYLASVYMVYSNRPRGTSWNSSVVRLDVRRNEEGRFTKRGVRGRQQCAPSVSTVRSCKRNVDRDLMRSPPHLRIGLRTYTDTIAPTGPWECVDYRRFVYDDE